jgi:hypothetical protein
VGFTFHDCVCLFPLPPTSLSSPTLLHSLFFFIYVIFSVQYYGQLGYTNYTLELTVCYSPLYESACDNNTILCQSAVNPVRNFALAYRNTISPVVNVNGNSPSFPSPSPSPLPRALLFLQSSNYSILFVMSPLSPLLSAICLWYHRSRDFCFI